MYIFRRGLELVITFAAFFSIIGLLWTIYQPDPYLQNPILISNITFFVLFIIVVISNLLAKERKFLFKRYWYDYFIILPLIAGYFFLQTQWNSDINWFMLIQHGTNFLIARQVIVVIYFFYRYFSINRLIGGYSYRPVLFYLAWLGIFIATGTVLLSLPISHQLDIKNVYFIDALLTALGAVTGTGMTFLQPATDLSLIGQMVLLLLMQIGGWISIAITTAIFYTFGEKILLGNRIGLNPNTVRAKGTGFQELVLQIIFLSVGIESVGAVLLAIGFYKYPMIDSLIEAAYLGIFHSVSAFCNVGFSLFPKSLIYFQQDPLILSTIGALSTLGSLGVVVLINLVSFFTPIRSDHSKDEKPLKNVISLHSRIVLITTAFLLLFGGLFIFVNEMFHSLKGLDLVEKIYLGIFTASISSTGFFAMDMNGLHSGTLSFLLLLMLIGGSPASTASGIKTTTIYILAYSIYCFLINKPLEIYKRSIYFDSILATFFILIFFVFTVILDCLLLFIIESPTRDEALVLIFNSVSCLSNSGWSVSSLDHIHWASKVILGILMILGRVMPIYIYMQIKLKSKDQSQIYPEMSVTIA